MYSRYHHNYTGSPGMQAVVRANYICPSDVSLLDAADEAAINYMQSLHKAQGESVQLVRNSIPVFSAHK